MALSDTLPPHADEINTIVPVGAIPINTYLDGILFFIV